MQKAVFRKGKEERRRQLLAAAIGVFSEKGYHRAQISDVIAAAKVARGTFYLYFEGKREIFDCIMTELFRQVREQVSSLPHDAIDKIPEQLRGNIERVARLLLEQPSLAKILFNESVGIDDDLDQRLKKFYGQLLGLIRSGLKQGQEMGFVRAGDCSILALCLLGSFKEVFYQYYLGTEQPSLQNIVSEVYRLVVHAIAAPQILAQLSIS